MTIITVAGQYKSKGYVDGPGDQARFIGVSGIQFADDGYLYVADTYNHKIRKITNEGIVSTVEIPKNSSGQSLSQPDDIRRQSDGTINIVAGGYDFQGSPNKFWIVKPGATVSITPSRRSTSDIYHVLATDPYNNYLFTAGQENVLNGNGVDHQKAFIEKFLPGPGNTYGAETQYLNALSGAIIPEVTSLYCGYNAVKYVVLHSQILLKLTPAGVFQTLYQDNKTFQIQDVIATKDSQTLYITEAGAIKAISKGNVRYLVGPHKNLNGKDGVGANADVYAFKLALSKDESTIYFTDGSNRIRKLILR